MKHYWTCRRVEQGATCGKRNPARKRNCERCGKERQRRSAPKHVVALEAPYEVYIALNGGERCAICLSPPSAKRKLDRDHDHRYGRPRGLLCQRCNRALPHWMTPEWLRAAAEYLENARELQRA